MPQRLNAIAARSGAQSIYVKVIQDRSTGVLFWELCHQPGIAERLHIDAMASSKVIWSPRGRDSPSLRTCFDLQSFRAHARLSDKKIPIEW